jgi:Family of unknown function (DUF5335)
VKLWARSRKRRNNVCTPVIPHAEWHEFLQAFSKRHAGWLVTIQTHDLKTGETVTSRLVRLERVELDLEDKNNARINVTIRDDQKEIKHILFRPSDVMLKISQDGSDEGLQIISVNTITTVRFRVATSPELVDGVA